jgi:hypothetical protein
VPDFKKHGVVLNLIEEAQGADKDEREMSRQARLFLDHPQGQWEPEIWSAYGKSKRPRYTLDKCNPIVNQIAGEIKKADFDIKVRPSGGDATKDNADLYDGMIRNIENISNASNVYNFAAKNMIGTGVDGWMICQDWADTESFDQDLFIKTVPSFVDSVWFDPNSQEQDRSDAKWAVKMTAMSKAAYEYKYPKGSGKSLTQDKRHEAYTYKPDQVIVGEFYWVDETPIMLVKMSDGSVYKEEELEPVRDELAAQGIVEEARRKRPDRTVHIRHLDGGGWLDKPQKTVFNWIPIIPIYGNFNITENKITWRGAIEKLMDAQRIYNYAVSRQIEEGALTPRDKVWMTREQAKGNEATLRTMNTNSDPVQFYNHVDGQMPPNRPGPAQANPSLVTTAEGAKRDIIESSGLFSSSVGDNPGLQSGVAIEQLQERGDTGTLDYFEALEIAIAHTGRILVDAIPKLYDTKRQVRILREDGSFELEMVNNMVLDEQTGQPVKLNDLSTGRYDVTCSVGKSFKSRQQESVAAIIEMAQIDPTVVEQGGDILLKNTNAPGLDKIAERKRALLLSNGLIPEEQWTDEERAKIEQAQAMAAQQPPEETPEMVLAKAEEKKGEADLIEQQNKQAEVQISAQKVMLEAEKLQLDKAKTAADIETNRIKAESDRIKAISQAEKAGAEVDNIEVDTAKTIQEIQMMSTEELAKLAQGMFPQQSEADISSMSNEELMEVLVGGQ